MQASFTDLVGTSVVFSASVDSGELLDLIPAVEMAMDFDGLAAESSGAAATGYSSTPTHNTCC